MATAATSLLGLALPVTGELSGTWGDTVNISITALLDTAVAGTTTLSSDADVTLTTTTLAANQARQAIILWTAGGTATRTITVPAQSKSYIVINKTSSSQSIKIVGAGPTTGVTIVAGTAALVVWNGVDFVTASVTSTTGVLPVANGGTGLTSGTSGGVLAYTATGTLASSTALAASALVIGGGAGAAPSTTTTGTGVVTALGVNTGSAGAFVVNGGVLGTPSSGTLTNATGLPISTGVSGLGTGIATALAVNVGTAGSPVVNGGALGSPSTAGTMPAFTLGGTVSGGGNQINNVVIGASTPLAGAFTTLNATGRLQVYNSSGADGGFRLSSTGDVSYFDFEVSDTTGLSIQQNNAQKLVISSTGLAVTGTLSATGTLSGGTSGTGYSFSGSAPATSLTLDASGRLGVGLTSMSAQLHVQNATGNSGLGNDNTGMVLVESTYAANASQANASFIAKNYYGYGQFMQWQNFGMRIGSRATANGGAGEVVFTYGNDSAGMTLDASGNFGIGTSSPSAKLDVRTALSATSGVQNIANFFPITSGTTDGTYGGSISLYTKNLNGNYWPAAIAAINDTGGSNLSALGFYTSVAGPTLTERARIDSSGNLLVGTTTAAGKVTFAGSGAASQTLTLNGTTTGANFARITSSGADGVLGIESSAGSAILSGSSANATVLYTVGATPLQFGTNSAVKATLDTSGNLLVGVTGTGTGGASEVRTATTGVNSFTTSSSGASPYGYYVKFTAANPNNTTNYFWNADSSTEQKAVIWSNGTFGSRTSTYGGISDVKLKQDIVDASSQWADIKAIRVRKYRFKSDPDGHLQIGVIAQELEQTSAGLIDESPDFGTDEDGNRIQLDTTTKSVKYSILYMKAVKALQEAMERIETLETKSDTQAVTINALTARITALESA